MSTQAVADYITERLSPRELLEFETNLIENPGRRAELAQAGDPTRLAGSMAAIAAELDTPRASRLERLVRRLGAGEPTARLVAATPAFRRSFVLAIGLMVLFTASNANSGDGTNRLLTYLTLAPAIPLLGTALAFGRAVDPMHEVTVSTPIEGFRLVMLRTLAVYSASLAVLIPASIFVEDIGPWRWGWLLPGLMLTSVMLALSTRFPAHLAAAGVGTAWFAVVTASSVASTNDVVIFQSLGQVAFLVVTALAAGITFVRRHQFDGIEGQ